MSMGGAGEINFTRGRLRGVALIAVLIGAAASLALMLRAGRHNNSRLLIAAMAIWVLSPFVILVLGDLVSKRWSVLTRAALYWVMLVITIGSLAVYVHDALHPRAKAAFVYVVVPPASWTVIAIAVPTAALISRRRARTAW
jgi:hypothetical protein